MFEGTKVGIKKTMLGLSYFSWFSISSTRVYHIYQPLRSGRIWRQGQFLNGVWQVWIQTIPSPRLVASTRLKNSLSYYLPIAGGGIIGFIPFPKVLVLYKMQSISSRIWTRVAVSISYDDNHYTTSTTFSLPWVFRLDKD